MRNELIEPIPNSSNLGIEFAFVDSILPDGLPIENNLNDSLCHGSKNAGRRLDDVQAAQRAACTLLSFMLAVEPFFPAARIDGRRTYACRDYRYSTQFHIAEIVIYRDSSARATDAFAS
ncbi:hypothetical protein [Burkholderia sp. ABCPW 14]|uniref:hypothetical protein n=1 Tax=Burkholderia sp. ABCPW 14 TaxID=1637860 RepID=UPI000AAEFBBD|nr:hypothetical protein [Burkholderia sp. ABCPW 14]